MKRYEVTGRPVGSAEFATAAVGSIIELDLSEDAEAALVGAGAIRPLAEPEPEPLVEPTPAVE